MIFNQFSFIFLFLPLVLLVFFFPGIRSLRSHVLLAASFIFYGLSGLEHAIILLAEIIWIFIIIKSNKIVGNKKLLILAIAPPFVALFYYKYLTFFISQIIDINSNNGSFSLFSDITLPAGISFFTYQIASIAIDRYRDRCPKMPPLRLLGCYISFFPQLVAGPILRFQDVVKSLENLYAFRLSGPLIARAIGFVTLGFAAKVLLADTLNNYLEPLITEPDNLSIISGLYVIIAYSFQIYFDFYGYSLIAIGLGSLFGFRFPDNFKRPYQALNPRDFWRRWHITLSSWIRDYLYLPLGGNQAYVRNILFTFALCGLWHGANWTFIIWGLYHASLVISYHYLKQWWDKIPRIIQCGITFTLVSLGWILFLFDFGRLKKFLFCLLNPVSLSGNNPNFEMWLFVAVSAAVCFGIRIEPFAENNRGGLIKTIGRNGMFALLFILVLFFIERSKTFIYFRF